VFGVGWGGERGREALKRLILMAPPVDFDPVEVRWFHLDKFLWSTTSL
jgi:hypothetical protein